MAAPQSGPARRDRDPKEAKAHLTPESMLRVGSKPNRDPATLSYGALIGRINPSERPTPATDSTSAWARSSVIDGTKGRLRGHAGPSMASAPVASAVHRRDWAVCAAA